MPIYIVMGTWLVGIKVGSYGLWWIGNFFFLWSPPHLQLLSFPPCTKLTGLGFAKCHIDDIIIFSLISKDHMHHLQEVFGRIKEHNLKFHLSKCQFFHTQVEYLGHMIYLGRLEVQKAKVKSISQVPQLINVSWLRVFLSLCNYYWRFVKGFSSIAKPLTWLT
jgi:hypothetical protein